MAQAPSAVQNVPIHRLFKLQKELGGPSLTIWLCALSVFVFLLWSAFAWIDEIVRADGEIISQSRPQIIQNLEGGILAQLNVAEGDIVEKGDVLARLQSTKFQSAVSDLKEQIDALEIRRLRIEAEMKGHSEFSAPQELIVRTPEIFESEQALLAARQLDYASRREGALSVLEQAQKEASLMEDMLKKKVVALIEVTRARKTLADTQTKYDEIVTNTELDRANSYSDTLKELATLRQNLKASQDQLNRTILHSPMRGVVNGLKITTIGGVVRPGEEILQIIPLNDELFVEARVKPENIANIRRGQEATVKLSAYDYTIYGTLKGKVEVVSADTFKEEHSREANGNPHYKVSVRINQEDMIRDHSVIEIRPGMQAQVELHTGERTVLQYLLKPLYKSREAMREP